MSTTAVKDLHTILKSLSPELREEEYVFCTFQAAQYGDYSHLNPIASFIESEGLTLVIEDCVARECNIASSTVMRCITLNVNSDLEAVGLTAIISKTLADHGISANVIAAYHHDHIFVQNESASDAINALKLLQKQHSKL